MSRIVSQLSLTSPRPSPYKGEGVRRTGEVYSSAQLQLVTAFSSFSRQATDPLSIASMTAVGLVGRVGQVGGVRLFGQNLFAHLTSLAGEAATCSLLQGGSFTSHFVNFSAFRFMGALTHAHNPLLQHFSQSLAMLTGHQVTAALHLEETSQESIAQQFLNTSLSTLHIGFGNFLGRALSGGRIQSFERNLKPFDFVYPEQCRGAQGRPLTPHPSPLNSPLPRFSMVRPAERYNSLLEHADPTLKTAALNALETPCTEPLRIQLLEAYKIAHDAGLTNLHRVSACLKFVFRLNAAHSSSGSFKNALLQEVVERTLEREETNQRNEALQNIFQTMNDGIDYTSLVSLAVRYAAPQFHCSRSSNFSIDFFSTYLEDIPTKGTHAWNNISAAHSNLLLNYIEHVASADPARVRKLIKTYGQAFNSDRYPRPLLEEVLNHALRSPLGEYILRRFTYILATEDVPAKLHELRDVAIVSMDESIPTGRLVIEMSMRGIRFEKIAEFLNASIHTAYLDDMRISRKVVSFYRSMGNWNQHPDKRIEAKRRMVRTFTDTILPRWKNGKSFSAEDLTDLLECNPSLSSEQFMESYRRGDFEVQVLDGNVFDQTVNSWGCAQNCTYSYFIQKPAPEKSVILIRRFDPEDIHDSSKYSEAFENIVFRLHYMLHEWEHWRHFTGHFEGHEKGGRPYNASLDRANRMGSEILAFLEEFRWITLHLDGELHHNLPFLGDPLIVYLRTLGDTTYYTKINDRQAREVIP